MSIRDFLKQFCGEAYSDTIRNTLIFRKSLASLRKEEKKPETNKNKSNTILEIGIRKYGLSFDCQDSVRDYLLKRKLDVSKFWYVENFYGMYCEASGKESNNRKDPRIVIPFIDNAAGRVYAMQGRAVNENQSPKYLTFLLDDNYMKMYNYCNIDRSSEVFVLEGPIDSMFLPNSVALAGANASEGVREFLKSLKATFVYDCDFSYNEEVRRQLKRAISDGMSVFIPPAGVNKFKDLNDMAISGMSKSDIYKLIKENTYSGIMASVVLSRFPIKKGDNTDKRGNTWT